MAQGANQYAPMTGVPALREAIAGKAAELYGYQPDVNSEITVTAGATEALYAGDRLRRRGHAGHRGVLIRPLRHVVRQTLLKIARAVKIGKALGQVYGLMLLGQGAHLGKNTPR